MSKRETDYQRKVREDYEEQGCIVIKMNPGSDVPMGFPDLLILMPCGATRLIEMKAPDGSTSPAQKYWHRRLHEMGHDAMLVRGD